jgi:hypothetical protein
MGLSGERCFLMENGALPTTPYREDDKKLVSQILTTV